MIAIDTLYNTRSAVLFIIFNRPSVTKEVFEAIKAAKPPRLYIAADGPRSHKPGEAELCQAARSIVVNVDWDCDVQTLYRDTNLGCKNAVSEAITWFFDNEKEGIILEDDCLPHNSFFRFCDELLAYYRHDTRVRHIGGVNFQQGQRHGAATYYFSNLTHVWGWAGWRRVWQDYDKDLKRYDVADVRHQLTKIFTEPLIVDTWVQIFEDVKAGKIDTWDYQLTFLNFFNNSLSVIPNTNLISNIGFGSDATHTTAVANPNANLPLVALPDEELMHPLYVLPVKEADTATLNYDFDIPRRKKKEKQLWAKVKKVVKPGKSKMPNCQPIF